jgi:hypothetical protein
MLKKKNETKRFFEDMEANIINKVCLPACLPVCLERLLMRHISQDSFGATLYRICVGQFLLLSEHMLSILHE